MEVSMDKKRKSNLPEEMLGMSKDPEWQAKMQEGRKKRFAADRAVKEAMTNPDIFREGGMKAILAEHPDAMDRFAEKLYTKAMDGDKTSMDIMVNMFDLKAPKKSEVTVKHEDISPDEALELLKKKMKDVDDG